MKNATTVMLAAACAALPLLAQPAHAQSQWVASAPVAVPNHLLRIENGMNGGTGKGSPGDPGVNGTGGGSGDFVAYSQSYGSSNHSTSDYEYGNQWQITYTWTGSGSPGYPVLVSVTEEADGISQGTTPASGNSSSSAQGGDSNNHNSTNPQALGGSCAVGGPNYYDPYNKPSSTSVVQLPMQDGPNPVIVVTIAAKSGGQCIQTPPGTTANWGSYTTKSNCSVTVNPPQ